MRRVLIVDSQSELIDLSKTLLKRRGELEFDAVASAKEAFGKLAESEYDAIVSGYRLLDINGIEFLRSLRGQGNEIPFILLSEKGKEVLAVEALDNGADFCLQRGGDPESQFSELVNMIDHSVERRKAEEALQLANRKLNLLGHVTRHDIRNQLTVLSGYLQLARDRTVDEKISRYLESSIKAMDKIDKLLEFGKDYEATGTMKPEWIDAKKVCEQQMSDLVLRNVTLKIDLEGLEILADELIGKVFYNLADNASKHGKNIKRIHFFYKESKDGMTLICQDDGFGVKREDKERILDGKRGHGLHLVSEILRTNGMSIKETGELGEGARFEIHIPNGSYRIKKS
ncbi:MAG: HAMP domain-containing sensor histidine kinase [Methanomassiliicoccales archaeon]|jgi:signal transduction histidine kinase